MPKALNIGLPPAELDYLWECFCEVKRGKLDYTELRNWADLTGRDLSPKEVEIIMQINSAFEATIHG